jgi:hypothetical protein
VYAGTLSYSGTFTFDSDVETIPFTLTAPGVVSAITFGYGGGTNAASQVFTAGGFAPSLALYLVSDSSLQAQDALGGSVIPAGGCSNGTNEDTSVDLCLDATLNFSAAAGSYILVLSEQSVNDGLDPMSYPLPPDTNATTPPFMDVFGNQRNGQFAIDVTLPDASTGVPEPATWTLMSSGILAGVAFARRKRT